MQGQTPEHTSLKQRAIEELKEFWITALYLFVFLSGFNFYRRMVLAEFGVTYLHYGISFIEAFIIAKIVLIGRALGLDKQIERRGGPLILSVVFKALIFSILTILFAVLEYMVEGWLHKKNWASIERGLLDIGGHELFARLIMLFISFVPFFAFWEIGRVIGRKKLIEVFFSKRGPSPQA